MIQLANDPNAKRMGWQSSARPAASSAAQPRRPGHAWPFLSKSVERAEAVDPDKPRRTGAGS